MTRLSIAIKAFFGALFYREEAEQYARVIAGERLGLPKPEAAPKTAPAPEPRKPAPKPPVRSDALALLATLQREARLVDFLQEDLTGFTDAQIGAAAREVHRASKAVVARLFELRAIVDQPEGSPIDVPAGFDPGRYHLTGQIAGEPPYRGQIAHHGWEASRCELPAWTGSDRAARVVAPVEVEVTP